MEMLTHGRTTDNGIQDGQKSPFIKKKKKKKKKMLVSVSVDKEIDRLTRSSINWSTSMSVLSFSSICWIGDVRCRGKLEVDSATGTAMKLEMLAIVSLSAGSISESRP